jgi:hypothetical protein
MSKPNNGQNQQQPGPRTKAEIVAQREQVRMLGIALGNWRETARQCGLSEGRILNWVVRYGWKRPKRIEAPHPREMLSPVVGVVTPAQSLEALLLISGVMYCAMTIRTQRNSIFHCVRSIPRKPNDMMNLEKRLIRCIPEWGCSAASITLPASS